MNWLTTIRVPEKISAELRLPASKSLSNRALIIRAICDYSFQIHNLSVADDTKLLYHLLNADENELYIKNAGTAFRFLTAYYASRDAEVVLRGSDRMHERPIEPLVSALKNLGAEIDYLDKEGFPPIFIKGHALAGGEISIDGSISSQFISALLMVAPTFEKGLLINIQNPISSAPYIKMTLEIMKYLGIEYQWENNSIFIRPQKYIPRDIFIESDWSSASYLYALAALIPDSEILLYDLFGHSLQGDAMLIHWMRLFGVESQFNNEGCRISSKKITRPQFFSINMQNQPDLIPTFVSLCTKLKVPFLIEGSKNLQFKESNRGLALQKELRKVGAQIELGENNIKCLEFNEIGEEDIYLETYNDHRLAMSFYLLTLNQPNVLIEDPLVSQKSYPDFWYDLKKVGFDFDHK